MYFVLALLCTDLDTNCSLRVYPDIQPSYQACFETKQEINRKLWEYKPDNASSLKTWCFMIPEDT